ADMLRGEGLECTKVSKGNDEKDGPSALALMRAGEIDFVINIAREYDAHGNPDGALIRRLAVHPEIPPVTDLAVARALVEATVAQPEDSLEALPWSSYAPRGSA